MTRLRFILFALGTAALLTGCESGGPSPAEEKAAVEDLIRGYHRVLEGAYQGRGVDLAGAFDRVFDLKGRYVTYWGTEEPIDTTRARAIGGVGKVTEYTNMVENVETRVYGEGAVITCIIRQEYMLQGFAIDEFLPTTYVLEKHDGMWKVVYTHRSADFETIRQQMEIMQHMKQQ
jgi:hypothetical protein